MKTAILVDGGFYRKRAKMIYSSTSMESALNGRNVVRTLIE